MKSPNIENLEKNINIAMKNHKSYQCNHRIPHRTQILNQLQVSPSANLPPKKMQRKMIGLD